MQTREQFTEVEVFVLVDSEGNSAIGDSTDAAKDKYEEDFTDNGVPRRVVKVVLRIPMPKLVEVSVDVPEEEAGEVAVRVSCPRLPPLVMRGHWSRPVWALFSCSFRPVSPLFPNPFPKRCWSGQVQNQVPRGASVQGRELRSIPHKPRPRRQHSCDQLDDLER